MNNIFALNLTGNIPDDIRALRRFTTVDTKKARAMLDRFYTIPYELRRIILTDRQVVDYNEAAKDSHFPRGFSLDTPVDIETQFDLTPFEKVRRDVQYTQPSPEITPMYWQEAYPVGEIYDLRY